MRNEDLESLTNDHATALADLDSARLTNSRIESDHATLETQYTLLKKELQDCQAALLSSRTTEEAEKDRIQKAVQKATSGKDEQLKKMSRELKAAKREIEKYEGHRVIDMKNIRELSQDKLNLKEKLADVAAVQEAIEKELEDKRAKNKALEKELMQLRSKTV